jgi:hypothetical protein
LPRPDSRGVEQRRDAAGFAHELVESGARGFLQGVVAATGQRNEPRRMTLLADAPRGFAAVDLRHRQIEQHGIGTEHRAEPRGLVAVRAFVDREPVRNQHLGNARTCERIVFCVDDPKRFRLHGRRYAMPRLTEALSVASSNAILRLKKRNYCTSARISFPRASYSTLP